MRILGIAVKLFSAGLILAGALLAAALFYPQILDISSGGEDSSVARTPETGGDIPGGSLAPAQPLKSSQPPEKNGPEKKTLKLTIPGMNRIEGDAVPNTTGDDERALKRNAGVHLKGTGFPWQREANVYIAGHRIGFPGTDSFLGFYDLNQLEPGDKVYVTDSEGERYTYRVFRQKVVAPSNTSVTRPVDGRNILTLQTCTLPDYTQRLIVQAQKVA